MPLLWNDCEKLPERMSDAFAEIVNIIITANFHRVRCSDSECGVKLYILGMTAKRLINNCWLSERERARRLINETIWT